jgi:hypothetical protein
MSIKLLRIHHCPSWQEAERNLKEALAILGINEVLETVEITTGSQSLAEDFGGSPTITLNGKDIFSHPDEVKDLACRVYVTSEGLHGSPSTDMIVEVLKEIARGS